MAHCSQTTDEQIIALTTNLNEMLRVQDAHSSPATGNGNQPHVSSSTLSNEIVSSSSILGSTQLSLVQFTLTVKQQVPNYVPQEHFGSSKAHIILHIDGASAVTSLTCDNDSNMNSPLEVVEIALISDKFPDNVLPIQIFSKNVMFLVKFWADFTFNEEALQTPGSFQVTSIFESSKLMNILCKTSVCSFGRSIGDKTEKLSGFQVGPDRFIYQSIGAPLCDYLVNFIRKLKVCSGVAMMNGVLENFSVLQVISDEQTHEILLCFLYVFEVCPPEVSANMGSMYKVYRLDDSSSAATFSDVVNV